MTSNAGVSGWRSSSAASVRSSFSARPSVAITTLTAGSTPRLPELLSIRTAHPTTGGRGRPPGGPASPPDYNDSAPGGRAPCASSDVGAGLVPARRPPRVLPYPRAGGRKGRPYTERPCPPSGRGPYDNPRGAGALARAAFARKPGGLCVAADARIGRRVDVRVGKAGVCKQTPLRKQQQRGRRSRPRSERHISYGRVPHRASVGRAPSPALGRDVLEGVRAPC